MSEDNELLKLAAKAVDLRCRLKFSDSPVINPTFIDMPGTWNPLHDDGDALRLAVRLRMLWSGTPAHANFSIFYRAELSKDMLPSEATRRAIVRAAAEIGKDQS